MVNDIRIEALTPWIEVLCEAGDARARDRLLLEAILALGLAGAAALWRRDAHGAWREHVARGAADLLPRAGDVEAIAARSIPPDVLPARRVHVHGDVALALGGIAGESGSPDDPVAPDAAEALLTTYACVAAGAGSEIWSAPLPAPGAASKPPAEGFEASPSSRAHTAGAEEARRVQHDLRNVMTSLRATEDLLARYADGLSPEESSRFKSTLDRECARAGELLAHGLSATVFAHRARDARLPPEVRRMDVGPQAAERNRIEPAAAGSVSDDPHPPACSRDACRPAVILEQVLEAERAACVLAGIRLERLIDPACRSYSCALSASGFARIVQNLVVNARAAIAAHIDAGAIGTQTATQAEPGSPRPPRGCVWVTLEHAQTDGGARIVLTVEDDGCGMARDDLERVFEPGFTSGSASDGRGLAIVRALARAAGGDAWAELRASGGARLRIRLPLCA